MITDSYSKMMSGIGMRSMMQSNDYGEELGLLLREQSRQQEASDRERELSLYRSGSAPPTVEGSLSAAGGLFGHGTVDSGGFSEEELRSDPAYISYYYSNVNLNPRLPPPLLSKEDWRFAQRLQGGGVSGGGGGGGAPLGGIGDRRNMNRGSASGGDDGDSHRSLFSANLGFGVKKEEDKMESRKEWGGDGLIGLPGLGLGNKQKSIAEIIQDDISQVPSLSRQPSRPTSRNAFDESVESSEPSFANIHHELASIDALSSATNFQGMPGIQNTASSSSHTYASALGGASSRSATPVGGRTNPLDKRIVNGLNSYNSNEHADLVAALSGLNLSTNAMADEETHLQSRIHHEIDDHQGVLYSKKSESGQFFPGMGKASGGVGMHLNNSELHKAADFSGHSYFRGPSAPTLNNGGGSPHYQNVGSPNSSFSSYGLRGYGSNPGSPSLLGNQMGVSGMDSRAMGGGLTLGPNLLAEFQNLRNNNAGNALQVPPMDPVYLQYLRSAEYAAAMDRENVGNSYMDLLGLQKAYLGAMLSSQKSQYGLPYLGKSSNLNHGSNPGFGVGLSYPGSPLAGHILPNSAISSGSPVRHGHFMRNLAGGVVWRPEAGTTLDEAFASSLLDEFKSNKTKCFELSEIAGHVVEFSADQYGSRFIQQKLETATAEEKNMVFHEIMPQALVLMTDVFGNYVIQKFFEHGTAPQIRELADQLTGHVLALSLQMYGCRVIQKAIEVVDLDQQTKMVAELDGHIMRCVRDQNGNHVIQKCIECIPERAIQFIISTFYEQVVTLSTHPYGCRVIQRVLEHCCDPKTQTIVMDEIMHSVCLLTQDQYGNYVIQHVLEHGKPDERSAIIKKLTGQIVQMSQQKFASNVVEKCLTFGTPEERQILVTEMLGSTDENEPLQVMMKDQFANYVVQKVLETCDDQQLELILNRIKVHLNALKKYTYGKHIVARVEKLVAAGERRIGILSAYSTA